MDGDGEGTTEARRAEDEKRRDEKRREETRREEKRREKRTAENDEVRQTQENQQMKVRWLAKQRRCTWTRVAARARVLYRELLLDVLTLVTILSRAFLAQLMPVNCLGSDSAMGALVCERNLRASPSHGPRDCLAVDGHHECSQTRACHWQWELRPLSPVQTGVGRRVAVAGAGGIAGPCPRCPAKPANPP